MDRKTQPPDLIAHKIVTNTGNPIRFYFEEGAVTVPVEPYREGSPETTDLPVSHVDAVVETAEIADGGMNVLSFSGIHVPGNEWERVGLRKHWEADDVDLRSPFRDIERRLELWGSREDNYHNSTPDDWGDGHLEPIPAESPLRTEWDPYDEDLPDYPSVPFNDLSLYVYAVHSEESDHDSRGFDRIEIGTIAGVEVLDENDLVEWPESPDIDKREIDVDLSPPPRHPEIEYKELDPLPQSGDVLDAVFSINRYAKQLSEKADSAYAVNKGAEARVHSLQKKALYKTKTVAVHRLVKADPSTISVKLHELNGENEMYCVYVGDETSFHQPMDAVEDSILVEVEDVSVSDSEEISFSASADVSETPISLQTALQVLEEHGLNANEYLDATVVEDYEWGYDISTLFDGIPEES